MNADEYSALEMDYEKERKAVYNFHQRVHNRIVEHLKKHGTIEITEQDNRFEQWCFAFLDMEGVYTVKAICLTEDGKSFFLACKSRGGDEYYIDWNTINNDMVIEDMIMDKIKLANRVVDC